MATSQLPRPSVRQLASNFKESILSCCVRLNEKRKEQTRLAGPKEGTQLADFGTFEQTGGFEGGEQVPPPPPGDDKITQWQAGYNVTNAIQVSS